MLKQNNIKINGIVVHGKGKGKTVGMPTANLLCNDKTIKIENAVYVTVVNVDKKNYIGVTNVGLRPSVDNDNNVTIETNILDFNKDIYDKEMQLVFLDKIRDIKKFANLYDVKNQVDKDKKRAKILVLKNLFITFFKIGAFTFGGGYAMISLVKDECVDKKSFVDEKEFLNLMSVAECTPGPIAINMSTFVGYRIMGYIGAIFSTLGIIIPSFIIIYIISMFFTNIYSYKIVADAFMGIRIAISVVIIRTAYNLFKNVYKTSKYKIRTIFLFLLYFAVVLFINYFKVEINSVLLVLLAVILGAILS